VTNVLAEAEAVARRGYARPIVIASIARPTGWTGVHTHFTEFMRVLDSLGQRATLVTPYTGQQRLASTLFAPRRVLERVNPSMNVWWYEEGHYRMLKRALTKVLCSAVEVTVYAQCPLSAEAALQARTGPHQKVKMVVHFNGSQADEWVSQVGLSPTSRVYAGIRARERRILPVLDGIVYVSRYMQGVLEGAIPALRDVESAVVPNFIPALTADGVQGRIADLISIGTLEPRKNQAYLLRVLHEAAQLGHPYRLTLVGDGPERASLESLARALGIRDQVDFRGFEANARQLLPAHRAYVHASRFENMPVVLIEALAAGLPVLAAPVGGVPEIVSDGIEGLYWDLSDPAAGARKLVDLIEDGDRLDAMSRSAEAKFSSTFESGAVAGRLFDFLIA